MRENNKGLSFVEVIIVVAIMSLLVTMAGFGLGLINGRPADECAQKIMYSLENTRTKAMGKFETTYRLYRDSSTGQIMMEESVTVSAGGTATNTTSVLGDDEVTVTYKLKGVATETTLTAGTSVIFNFDRTNGAITGTDYCEQIKVSKANREHTITIVGPTGKISMD